MKSAIYNKNQLGFFPLYPYTADVNSLQPHINRKNGYSEHQLFLVADGSCILKVENDSFALGKNDLFYLASNVPHEYYGTDPNFKTTYISFNGDGFDGIKNYYNLKNYGVYKNKNKASFEECVNNLFNIFDTVHEVSSLCSLTFSAVIAFFDEACRKEYSFIEQVYHYIKENYSKNITLDDILTVYPYSKSKLCREFKEKYNLTVFEAVTKIRLGHARRILKAFPNLTLSKVALMCGFNDVSYFCRMYKRIYHSSPKSLY